jgi:hypothetical protein
MSLPQQSLCTHWKEKLVAFNARYAEPSAVAPDARVNFNARHAEPCGVAPDARVNFNARHAEPCAVAPDARVNFGVVIIQGLAEETCYRQHLLISSLRLCG